MGNQLCFFSTFRLTTTRSTRLIGFPPGPRSKSMAVLFRYLGSPFRFHRRKSQKRAPSKASSTARSITSCSKNFRSEEHTSELQSLMRISYAVFCLKKKNKNKLHTTHDIK